MKTSLPFRQAGSILPTALMSTTILAMIAAASMYRVMPRLSTTYHSASWAEALCAAETGADMALKAANASIVTPATAWAAWTPSDATTFPKTWVPTIAAHGGDGNTKIYTKVTIDNSIVDGAGNKWLRVRSMGAAELPAASRNGIEGGVRDISGSKTFRSILRKERYKTDATGGVLHLPQMVRNVEVVAAPVGRRQYLRALTVQGGITMSGSSSVDSFDSTDPTKSTAGAYDDKKRQSHGSIATNSSGALSDLKNSFIYGDASSNGGMIQNTANVQGDVYNNFQTPIPPMPKPVFSSINVTPSTINTSPVPVVLQGGPAGSPQNYKLTELTIKNSSGALILSPHAVGAESYINIWVTGKTSVTGSGFIQQLTGVHVKYYFEDDVTLSGNGAINETGRAANMEFFGISPASGTKTMNIASSADFVGVVYAPAFALGIKSGFFAGAAVANSAIFSGSGGFHYDESLVNIPGFITTEYQYASWVEDIR